MPMHYFMVGIHSNDHRDNADRRLGLELARACHDAFSFEASVASVSQDSLGEAHVAGLRTVSINHNPQKGTAEQVDG